MNLARALDIADYAVGKVVGFPTWDQALQIKPVRLYAGKLRRGLPQHGTHWGITPFYGSSRNIPHDLAEPFPIPANTVSVFQSEDVFEHIPLAKVPAIIAEIHRVLEPGGLFRLSVPDYRCSVYLDRTIRDEAGKLLHDPGGGGYLEDGVVKGGGHLWFPTIETVRDVFANSPFERVDFLHYYAEDGTLVQRPIDYRLGYVQRTPDHDPRGAVSIVVDARKGFSDDI